MGVGLPPLFPGYLFSNTAGEEQSFPEGDTMFDAGIIWLRGAVNGLHRKRQRERDLRQAIEDVVEIADPLIRLAHRYRRTLGPAVATAMAYCDELVRVIPGPVRLEPHSYYDDPLVKAVFRSADEMEIVLRNARNHELPGTEEEIFGLLLMDRTEKTVFGSSRQGDVVLHNVPMQAVTFTNHRIVARAADLEATVTLLKQRILEVLAGVALERIAALKANLTELRERRQQLGSMYRILCGKPRVFELFCQSELAQAEKVREVKELLGATDEDINEARKAVETPDDTLLHLKRIMDFPADTLVVRPQSQRLDWKNVIVDDRRDTEASVISLAEFTVNRELKRSAVLVRFDRK